jgi:hypothetical protein
MEYIIWLIYSFHYLSHTLFVVSLLYMCRVLYICPSSHYLFSHHRHHFIAAANHLLDHCTIARHVGYRETSHSTIPRQPISNRVAHWLPRNRQVHWLPRQQVLQQTELTVSIGRCPPQPHELCGAAHPARPAAVAPSTVFLLDRRWTAWVCIASTQWVNARYTTNQRAHNRPTCTQQIDQLSKHSK